MSENGDSSEWNKTIITCQKKCETNNKTNRGKNLIKCEDINDMVATVVNRNRSEICLYYCLHMIQAIIIKMKRNKMYFYTLIWKIFMRRCSSSVSFLPIP